MHVVWKKVSTGGKTALLRHSRQHRNMLRHCDNFTDFNFAEVWIAQSVNGRSAVTINLSDTRHCPCCEKVRKQRCKLKNNIHNKLSVDLNHLWRCKIIVPSFHLHESSMFLEIGHSTWVAEGRPALLDDS